MADKQIGVLEIVPEETENSTLTQHSDVDSNEFDGHAYLNWRLLRESSDSWTDDEVSEPGVEI